ncbi:MAG: flavin-containing monooxygenase, partial [Pseudomonadales bacterium]
GLPACKALAERGLAYECFEASDSVGGVWNIERGGGGYRSLHTNTSPRAMSYSDFPLEHDTPTYPTAAQMLSYFKGYAKHFKLDENIRLQSPVVRVQPLVDGGWEIELENGELRQYSSVIVATGQYNSPRLPHDLTPGEFTGTHLHICDYLDVATPIDLRGKRVVVVGLGSSAAEIATELCGFNQEGREDREDREGDEQYASQVILSARSGRWVFPKMVNGTPMDARAPHPAARVPTALRVLPGNSGSWLARRVLGKTLRNLSAKVGGTTALGLPTPTIKPWEDRPTMSQGFIPALQKGLIDTRPGIERFAGSTVHFTDGTQTQADVILYATGYQLDFPFLDDETLGCAAPELALYQRIAHPAHEQLFFVGCCRVMCSMWPLAEQQGRWVADVLAGGFSLPNNATRKKQAVALVKSLPVICNFYVEQLRKEARGM